MDVERTRRRAAARGRVGVAQWRIESGVWAARAIAIVLLAGALFPLIRGRLPEVATGITLGCAAGGVLVAGELMRRGSRMAAGVLFCAFVAVTAYSRVFAHEPLWPSTIWNAALAFALGNGVWGTFALAAAKRDATRAGL